MLRAGLAAVMPPLMVKVYGSVTVAATGGTAAEATVMVPL
jgi:hypothetical protein